MLIIQNATITYKMALAGATGRRKRTPLLAEQRKILEDAFKSGSISSNKFIRGSKEIVKRKAERLEGLADKTGLSIRQVRQWFVNRRKKDKLHVKRVSNHMIGDTPFVRMGTLGKKKMEEEINSFGEGIPPTKPGKKFKSDCANISFSDLIGTNFGPAVVESFKTIHCFLAGELRIVREPFNDERCDKYLRDRGSHKTNCVNFCLAVSEFYFGNALSNAVSLIAENGQIEHLINLIMHEKTHLQLKRNFRYTILYSLISVYGGNPLIASIMASVSKSLGHASTYDMGEIVSNLPELNDHGYREHFINAFTPKAGRKATKLKKQKNGNGSSKKANKRTVISRYRPSGTL